MGDVTEIRIANRTNQVEKEIFLKRFKTIKMNSANSLAIYHILCSLHEFHLHSV